MAKSWAPVNIRCGKKMYTAVLGRDAKDEKVNLVRVCDKISEVSYVCNITDEIMPEICSHKLAAVFSAEDVGDEFFGAFSKGPREYTYRFVNPIDCKDGNYMSAFFLSSFCFSCLMKL